MALPEPDLTRIETLIGVKYDPQHVDDWLQLAQAIALVNIFEALTEPDGLVDELRKIRRRLGDLRDTLPEVVTELAEIKQVLIDMPGPP